MNKLLYFIVLSIFFISCKNETANPEQTTESSLIAVTKSQFDTSEMIVGSPKEQLFDVTINTSGKIDVPPQNRAKVTTFLGGYVKATKLLVGNKVVKGQALLTLENTQFIDLQKDYLEVAEQINYLESEYNRQKTLFNEQISSQKNYLKAESDYRKTKGIYNSLKAKLKMLNINPNQVERGNFVSTITIFAPISGDIAVMNANVGMFVSPADVILEIIDTSHLHLEIAVFEKDILKVKENQKILFKVPEASDEIFNANVHLVGKSIENNDRTINVHGHLDDKIKQRLLTGMFVEAGIIISQKKGMAIPINALVSKNNKNYILLLESDNGKEYKFKKFNVSIGNKSEDYVEILPNDKINLNSKILIKGAFDLID